MEMPSPSKTLLDRLDVSVRPDVHVARAADFQAGMPPIALVIVRSDVADLVVADLRLLTRQLCACGDASRPG